MRFIPTLTVEHKYLLFLSNSCDLEATNSFLILLIFPSFLLLFWLFLVAKIITRNYTAEIWSKNSTIGLFSSSSFYSVWPQLKIFWTRYCYKCSIKAFCEVKWFFAFILMIYLLLIELQDRLKMEIINKI